MVEIDKVFYEGNLKQVSELLTNPARSGIYLTRTRIRRIGLEMGLRTGVQSRSRMVENLFREAGTDGRVEELLERLDQEAQAWIRRFRQWSNDCPPSKSNWKKWSSQTRELRRSLRRAKKWASKVAREISAGKIQPSS